MGIRYESLNAAVRDHMLQELQQSINNRSLYISPRLTELGAREWPVLLRDAIGGHDDDWLAANLRARGYMRTEETRKKPNGGFTVAQVPGNAPDTLAEGEFNRFYCRGLCAEVLASGGHQVEVYRGKEAAHPRRESEQLIGQHLPAEKLLEDLRDSQGVEPALGVPPGPNSGLTIRRV